MLAVIFNGAGGNEVIRVAERDDPVPGSREVLVAVTHAGINPADIGQREGRYPAPPGAPGDVAGIEVAGTVTRCGPGVSHWHEGDRVFGLVDGGGLASRVTVHERCLAAVPEELTDDEAAAAPEAFLTAHDALVTLGRLRPGDRVLVNGANGGVGSAALQLVAAFGGTAVGTSRSAVGLEFIRSLGATAIGQDGLIGQGVSDAGQFDVIIELVGGPNLDHLVSLLAPRGRGIFVGTPAGGQIDGSIRPLMRKRASLIGTNLRNRPMEEKALAVQLFAREVVPLLRSREVVAHVDRCFSLTEVASAFDHLASSGKQGKVLLAFPASEGTVHG